MATPEFINQFRSISLCNVSYKVQTKILVNRLKPIMPYIIPPPHQSRFIPTHSIYENVVVAWDIKHSMRKMRGKLGYFVIKVDLAKAYGRMK